MLLCMVLAVLVAGLLTIYLFPYILGFLILMHNGIITDFYAQTAVLVIFLTLGLETGFFSFYF